MELRLKLMMLNEMIRKLRTARGISQVELAAALNVTKQSVSNWENNNIQPSIEMLLKIAAYFSVSTDYLLGIDERQYIEVTELTDEQISHLRQIANDLQKNNRNEKRPS